MISENTSILKLSGSGGRGITDAIVLNRLASEHPLIEELALLWYSFNADDAIALIRQLSALKRFRFEIRDRNECERFLKQSDNKWQHNVKPGLNNIVDINRYIE